MKISLATNNMGISDKLRFRHHILSLMLGLPVVSSGEPRTESRRPHLYLMRSVTGARQP